MESAQLKNFRKKQAYEFLEIIEYPKELISENIINLTEIFIYESEIKLFPNNKRNEYNRKLFYHFKKLDKDFDIRTLFVNYYLSNKDLYTLDIYDYLRLIFKEIKINRFLEEKIFLNDSFQNHFLQDECVKWHLVKPNVLFSDFKIAPNQINSRIHKIINENEIYLSTHIDLLLKELEDYEQKFSDFYNDKYRENFIFSYSPYDIRINSLIRLYFRITDYIYKETLKIDKNKINNIFEIFEKYENYIPKSFNSFKKEMNNFFSCLYIFQIKKLYTANSETLKLLIGDYIYEEYKNLKVPPRELFRIESELGKNISIKYYSKKELFKIISKDNNESNYSNFCRNIEILEKFIDFMNKIGFTFDKYNLKTYGLLYQELIEKSEKFENTNTRKIILNIINGRKNVKGSEIYFLEHKINRVLFIADNSVEEYENYIKMKIKTHEIMLKSISDKTGENIFNLLKDLLNNFKDSFPNFITKYAETLPLDKNIKTTKPYKEFLSKK